MTPYLCLVLMMARYTSPKIKHTVYSHCQVFLWRVPDGFTLHLDIPADEIEDIAPVGKLSGHPKYAAISIGECRC